MCPSAIRVLGRPMSSGVRRPGSKLYQNLPWTGGDMRAKFYQDPRRSLDCHKPSIYQQTYRQTGQDVMAN